MIGKKIEEGEGRKKGRDENRRRKEYSIRYNIIIYNNIIYTIKHITPAQPISNPRTQIRREYK